MNNCSRTPGYKVAEREVKSRSGEWYGIGCGNFYQATEIVPSGLRSLQSIGSHLIERPKRWEPGAHCKWDAFQEDEMLSAKAWGWGTREGER